MDVVTAEQQQDGAVARLAALLSHLDEISRRAKRARPGDTRTERQIVADFVRQSVEPEQLREGLRAVLAERAQMAKLLGIGVDREQWDALAEQLAAVTARAERAEARLAELGEPEVEYGLQYGAAAPQALRAQDEIAYYRRQRHAGLRVRDVYRAPWRVAADAAQDAQSAPGRVRTEPDGASE